MYKIIVIGGSAGSFQLILKLLAKIPKDFSIPIVLCLHRLKHVRNGVTESFNLKSNKIVTEPEDKEMIKPGNIYLAPANYHLLAELGNRFALSTDETVKFSRPSIDVCFDSFSYIYKEKMLGIILTGANSDGAQGIFKAHKRGATVLTQSPEDSALKTMPEAAIKLIPNINQKSFDDIIKYILNLDKFVHE